MTLGVSCRLGMEDEIPPDDRRTGDYETECGDLSGATEGAMIPEPIGWIRNGLICEIWVDSNRVWGLSIVCLRSLPKDFGISREVAQFF